MPNKNYTRYSNQRPKNHRDSEEIKERNPLIDEVVYAIEVKDDPVVAKVTKKAGVIANCDRLNIRKGPSVDTEILAVVDRGTKVVVEPISNNEFYKVYVESGIEGYAMKAYIALRG